MIRTFHIHVQNDPSVGIPDAHFVVADIEIQDAAHHALCVKALKDAFTTICDPIRGVRVTAHNNDGSY